MIFRWFYHRFHVTYRLKPVLFVVQIVCCGISVSYTNTSCSSLPENTEIKLWLSYSHDSMTQGPLAKKNVSSYIFKIKALSNHGSLCQIVSLFRTWEKRTREFFAQDKCSCLICNFFLEGCCLKILYKNTSNIDHLATPHLMVMINDDDAELLTESMEASLTRNSRWSGELNT